MRVFLQIYSSLRISTNFRFIFLLEKWWIWFMVWWAGSTERGAQVYGVDLKPAVES
jgi:hypothetical protein